MSRYPTEMTGTFFLVLTIGLTAVGEVAMARRHRLPVLSPGGLMVDVLDELREGRSRLALEEEYRDLDTHAPGDGHVLELTSRAGRPYVGLRGSSGVADSKKEPRGLLRSPSRGNGLDA